MKTIKTITILTVLVLFQNGIRAQKLKNQIVKSISQMEESYTAIEDDRKMMLNQLASRIFRDSKNQENTNVVFIDRHNKERSQLAAIWLRTGLMYYGLHRYTVRSAGTEIIQEPISALNSLEEYGFKVSNAGGKEPYSYNVKSGSEKWKVKYKNYEALHLNDEAVIKIYVEKGIVSEDEAKQIEVFLSSPESIAREMLYVSSRIKFLREKLQ
ncbi:MAG: hypothetical protein AAFX53_14035 [Bacteroidota bacterium]